VLHHVVLHELAARASRVEPAGGGGTRTTEFPTRVLGGAGSPRPPRSRRGEGSGRYSAEKQLLKALPRMARTASSPALKKAFEIHRDETEVYVQRLTDLAELLEMKPAASGARRWPA